MKRILLVLGFCLSSVSFASEETVLSANPIEYDCNKTRAGCRPEKFYPKESCEISRVGCIAVGDLAALLFKKLKTIVKPSSIENIIGASIRQTVQAAIQEENQYTLVTCTESVARVAQSHCSFHTVSGEPEEGLKAFSAAEFLNFLGH